MTPPERQRVNALLREPGSFEGSGLSRMETQAGDLSSTYYVNEPEVALHGNAAGHSPCLLMNPHQHPLSRVYELLWRGGPILKVLSPFRQCLEKAVFPVIDSVIGLYTVRDQIIGHQIDDLAYVAPVECSKGTRISFTFSSDMAYSDSPAASRASVLSRKSSWQVTQSSASNVNS